VSLASRSVRSVGWNAFASPVRIGVQLVRAVVLARLLGPQVFGLYAMASTIVRLTALVTGFGTAAAFINRTPETSDEQRAAAAHFTLKLGLTVVWLAAILTYARAGIGQIFDEYPGLPFALAALALITAATQTLITPRMILQRRVAYGRLALDDTLGTVLGTAAALAAAIHFRDVRALLAADLGVLTASALVLYGWRPVWRPRLAWPSDIIRYYLRFGSRNFPAVVLSNLLDRLDDLWTGVYLGGEAMGFYNRAYRFATLPRAVLASPAEDVSRSTYAELKGDRLRLSKAFFRVNAALVRTGFAAAGLLIAVAPEFIRLVLGREWLPMLDAFRFLALFALLEPIKLTVAGLFVAVGEPGKVLRSRLLQLAVMVAGLYTLGGRFSLAGVGMAVNLMLLAGLVSLLWQARAHVDFSLRGLFLTPTAALVAGLAGARAAVEVPGILGSDWRTGALKVAAFGVLYTGCLLAFERERLLAAVRMTLHHFRTTGVDADPPPTSDDRNSP